MRPDLDEPTLTFRQDAPLSIPKRLIDMPSYPGHGEYRTLPRFPVEQMIASDDMQLLASALYA